MIIKPEGTQIIVSGGTATVNNGVGVVKINPSGLLASLNISFPTNPSDRDELLMIFGGSSLTSGLTITLLTISSTNVLGSVPIATAGTCVSYIYDAATNKWFRRI